MRRTAHPAAAPRGLLRAVSLLVFASAVVAMGGAALPGPDLSGAPWPAVHAGVGCAHHAAGGAPHDADDAPDPGCRGAIRPGAGLILDDEVTCTLGWIVRDEAGTLYAATAGHCFSLLFCTQGAAASPEARAVAVRGVADDIGDPVYSTGNCGVGRDFALIRIDATLHHRVDARMCRWGGPSGMHTTGGDQWLLHHGQGVAFSALPATQPRIASMEGADWGEASFAFLGAIHSGDSGAPIMVWQPEARQGHAAGIITHTQLPLPAPNVGEQYASRLDYHLDRAGQALGRTFTLVTSGEPVDLVRYEVT